jgi:hypothetical protein
MKRRHLRDDAIKFSEDACNCVPNVRWISSPVSLTEALRKLLKLIDTVDLLHRLPYSPRCWHARRKRMPVNEDITEACAARLRCRRCGCQAPNALEDPSNLDGKIHVWATNNLPKSLLKRTT